MRVVLLGGTGFIGSAVTRLLAARGDDVIIPTRSPQRHAAIASANVILAPWNGSDPAPLAELVTDAHAVVNLLGENIAAGRWTPALKARIVASRVNAGEALVAACRKASSPPQVVIQASAVGYYGGWPDALTAPVRTEAAPSGHGFLAETARQWEASTAPLADMGIARSIIRTSVVLGAHGGALARMLPAFRAFAGGPLGSGRQPFAWIHLEDEARAILHLMDRPQLSGPFNLAAPQAVSLTQFCNALGKVLHRPSWLAAPAFALRLAFGDMADEALLTGQITPPARLLESGFTFTYPTLEAALGNIAGQAAA